MRALAGECLTVPRFDTDVPGAYFVVLKCVAWDENKGGVWKEPGVYANLKKVFEGILADPEHAGEVPLWATRYAAIAYLTGNLQDAAKAFGLAGSQVDAQEFRQLTGKSVILVRSQVPGAGGP